MVAPPHGCSCAPDGGDGGLCDLCIERSVYYLGSTASVRGYVWARNVRVRIRQPPAHWPTWDESERVRELAREKVRDMAKDVALLDRLARLVIKGAVEGWSATGWWEPRRQRPPRRNDRSVTR